MTLLENALFYGLFFFAGVSIVGEIFFWKWEKQLKKRATKL